MKALLAREARHIIDSLGIKGATSITIKCALDGVRVKWDTLDENGLTGTLDEGYAAPDSLASQIVGALGLDQCVTCEIRIDQDSPVTIIAEKYTTKEIDKAVGDLLVHYRMYQDITTLDSTAKEFKPVASQSLEYQKKILEESKKQSELLRSLFKQEAE